VIDVMVVSVSQSGKPAKRALASVADARAAMLAAVRPLGSEKVSLDHALNRVLAEGVTATRDQPPFDVSAMDGYAVRSLDTPDTLRLAGESAAGRGFAGRCDKGMTIRISTGAAVPDGADGVAIQEDVERNGRNVKVPKTRAGQNIRLRGGDFKAGALLLTRGRLLDGVGVSLAAAAGQATLLVKQKPRVTILSSGDELAAPGSEPGCWQIFDSATYAIAAQARKWGASVQRLAVVRDDAAAIAASAEKGLRDSDLLVVIGGASVGEHDHARPALMRLGLEISVEKVAVRPGKPTWFGLTPLGAVLGLPGNPASALVCAEIFLKPMLIAMQDRDAGPGIHRAVLAAPLPANGPREHYLRGVLTADEDGRLTVRAFEDQDSSLLSVFASANALIRLSADVPAMPAGALVDVLPLDGLGC
jgi:molybdopterin molybdotransferase